jgi:hypothetical protein
MVDAHEVSVAKEYLNRVAEAQRRHGHTSKLSREKHREAVDRTAAVFRRLESAVDRARATSESRPVPTKRSAGQ